MARAKNRFVPVHNGFTLSVPASGARHLRGGLFCDDGNGDTVLHPSVKKDLDEMLDRSPTPEIWMVAAVRCNEASRLTLYEHSEPFAIASRANGEEQVAGRGRIFSDLLFKEILRERLAKLPDELAMLRALPVAGVIQMAPPPPLRCNGDIEALLPESAVNKARELGLIEDEFSISPLALRKRAWELECAVSEEISKQAGVLFLKHDNKLIGPDGLRGKDSAQDAVHGNALWGLALLQQIEATIMAQKAA